jgi:nicotinate-nucleotide pyrophosphorylase (carboxylating)
VSDEVDTALLDAGLDPREVRRLVEVALDEDLRFGPDVTTDSTIRSDQIARAQVAARETGVVCGGPVALAVLDAVGFPLSGVELDVIDGGDVRAGTVVMSLEGPLRALLLAERTLLNFMTHLSGVASATSAWSRALEGTNCRVRDTRKTTPGLRQLEKYAVRCGGGVNHRLGLGDAALIKDNHVAATGSITVAIENVRRHHPGVALEVECDTLEQVEEALSARCSLILLDNMSVQQIGQAVQLARRFPEVRLEASGGLTLATAAEVAATGVDFVAVGALTHSVRALDLGLDLL